MGLDLDSSKVSWRVTAEQRLLARPTKAQRLAARSLAYGGGLGDLFWLSDEAWPQSEPHLPKNQPVARRVDDRRVISGILHVLKSRRRCGIVPRPMGLVPR